MILETSIIEFKGMPLFQKARFRPPMEMQGAFKDFACFFYMLEGDMQSFSAQGLKVVREKDAILKSCSSYIQRYVGNEETEECEAIAIYLYPDMLRAIYKDEIPGFLQNDRPHAPRKIISNRLIEQYIANLLIYFDSPEVVDEELGILKLKELMAILLRSEDFQNIREIFSEIFTPVNIKFRKAIEKNIFNALSLEQLAFICSMSLSTFKREFKKEFEETPARYIKLKRLDHAARLLMNGTESVSQIAYESGFQDPSTFSSVFTDQFGCSPSTYRLNGINKS